MKAYAIAFFGSLSMLVAGCNIDVDDCGDDDWDDDDGEQPCETHVHSDTATSTVSGGSGGSQSQPTGGGPSDSGGSSGSGGTGSGGAGGGASDGGSGATGSAVGGNGSTGAGDSGGSGSGSDTDTTGAAGACTDCNPLPNGESCLWGVQKMDSCCSVDVLVDVAAQECADYGLELSDFVLQDACSGGHQQVDFQCCKTGMSGCTTEEVSLESCVGDGVLSVLADQLCADMGQELSSFEASQACGDESYQGVEVTCCVMDPE